MPCKTQHINELRQAVETALPTTTTVPWGRGNRVGVSTNIHAQDLLDVRTGVGQVWSHASISAGPMLWNESVPGTGELGKVLRASHVDDLRRWFNTSETGVANYQFPRVRPLLFGINPSWSEFQASPQYSNDAMLAKIRAAGATCIRAGIDWACIEPAAPVNGQHTYYWDATQAPANVRCSNARNYEADIQLALAHGLTFVAVVGTAPNWATGNTSGQMPPNQSPSGDFHAFVVAMAQHFQGRIHHYEFNNEPDADNGWHGLSSDRFADGANYVPWLQSFSTAVKSVDPNAWVSTGGVSNVSDPAGLQFIRGIYSAANARSSFDAISCHPYATPNIDAAGVGSLRSIMNANQDYFKPIWVTEYGWDMTRVTEPDQATYLSTSLGDFANIPSVTIASFQIIADIYGPGGMNTIMGLCHQDLSGRQAYGTFSGYQKPTT